MFHLRKIIIFSLITTCVYSQESETIVDTDFTIRDFFIQNDSVFFIKKRDVFLQNIKTGNYKSFFLGGYGLELYFSQSSNSIIAASNELVDNVCSVRFYDKIKNETENIFYYKNGKIIDFLVIPEIKTFVLSLSNKKIIFINYSERPRFIKNIEIKLVAKSRRLIFKNNTLFFITDNGQIYKYSLQDNSKQLVYKCNDIITDFFIDNENLIYFTIDGKLVKINRFNKKKSELLIENNFILNSLKINQNNTLICGSWDGTIYEIILENFSIINEYKYHSRTVLNVKSDEDGYIYSCGLDKTIKKWKLYYN